jgi:hypothetical protein
MSRADAEWQRIVRDASERGRTAEGIGLRWDAAGWTLEEIRYRNGLSSWDRRQLEQDIIDALDRPPERNVDGWTRLAEKMIPKLDTVWRDQKRPSVRRTAELLGIHRETLAAWIRKRWWSPPNR